MAFYEVDLLKCNIEEYLLKYDRLEAYQLEQESWIDPSSREMIEFAYKQVQSAREFSKRLYSSDYIKTTAPRKPIGEVIDAVHKLDDVLESHVSKQMDPESQGRGGDIHNLQMEIHSFTQTMHKLEEDYADELYNFFHGGEDDEDEEVLDGDKSKMIGFSDYYNDLKLLLTNWVRFLVVSLCGMPGIGKTTLAREIFEDPDIVEHFECRVWVRVGRKCTFKEILRRILVEVSPDHVVGEEGEDIIGCLNECLQGKRYLIVLDDIWDNYAAYCLKGPVHRGNEMSDQFPQELGSRILVISRLEQINENSDFIIEMQLMNTEESWDLLREKVFSQESCPHHLETTGRKIAEKCEGLPLIIVTVASLLSKQDKTANYWNEVVTKKNHQLFKAAYNEILKVLLPSYKYLSRSLQMCFMYIGVFPQYYEIPRSRLINLWIVDGFIEQNQEALTEEGAILCLEELVTNNMVMIKTTINSDWLTVGNKQIKTCRLHSSLWHLSNREARRNKFSLVLDSRDDGFGEDIKNQARLSFHCNVLFAIKDLHKSVEDNCASTSHSLLCYGPYLQYQVPICFGLRLLKLDALTIRLYEFPKELLQLVELRYLALTLNGNLPAAIAQLLKLQCLIVHPHQSIKMSKESFYLPMEIWKLRNVQHLQVMGKDLPNPGDALLENLKTLSRVSHNSCTADVFKAIPFLEKLGIEVEVSHDDDGEPINCLAHVSYLTYLHSLKCVVVNPNPIPSFSPLSAFPMFLSKLTLSGMGYAWEELSNIDSLKYLKMLKLRNYAFRGPEWKVRGVQFPKLQTLLIEDTDLERWRIGHKNLNMECLIITSAYKLKEIRGKFGLSVRQIEMADCNPLGVEEMNKAVKWGKVKVSCSWYEKPKA